MPLESAAGVYPDGRQGAPTLMSVRLSHDGCHAQCASAADARTQIEFGRELGPLFTRQRTTRQADAMSGMGHQLT